MFTSLFNELALMSGDEELDGDEEVNDDAEELEIGELPRLVVLVAPREALSKNDC